MLGHAGFADYSAAKAGVVEFTRALAKEVAAYGINVNSVAPGPIATRGVQAVRGSNQFDQLRGLGRIGKPKEIAAMVAFFCTGDSDFITGQVFPVRVVEFRDCIVTTDHGYSANRHG